MNNIDKKRGKINILVYDKKRAIINNSIVKSKEIICPKCYENCRIKMNNYKIILYGCKNEHIIKNILLEKFNETQMIDESKIICSNCNNNKSNAYNKEFYKCLKCDLNLCPLCKSIHDKEHKIIDYEKRNYFCNIHNESFFSFCEECNLNLCIFCEKKHNNNHKIINYKDILLEENEIKDKLKEFKNRINEYEKSIKEIINIFNNVIDNIEIYYKINNDLLNNYENKNYHNLKNINEIVNNIKLNDIRKINNINDRISNILDIYNKMKKKDNDNEINKKIFQNEKINT